METGRIVGYLCTIIFPHSEENILNHEILKSYFQIAQMKPKSAGSSQLSTQITQLFLRLIL